MEKKLNDVLDDSIRQVRELVDANTSVGAPIALGDGITLVPISKISVGWSFRATVCVCSRSASLRATPSNARSISSRCWSTRSAT